MKTTTQRILALAVAPPTAHGIHVRARPTGATSPFHIPAARLR
ncbi:hypothetical protein AB0I77_33925 [Streptomyces sp. NPDC050619]